MADKQIKADSRLPLARATSYYTLDIRLKLEVERMNLLAMDKSAIEEKPSHLNL